MSTSTRPTEPGWYWAERPGHEPKPVRIERHPNGIDLVVEGYYLNECLATFTKLVPMTEHAVTAVNVLSVCHAYESGFGHAERDLVNPYPEESVEYVAYGIGKQEGLERKAAPETDAGDEDTERLNWVQSTQVRIEPILDMDGKVWNVRTNLGKTSRAAVLREAIDAAIKAAREEVEVKVKEPGG